MALPVVKSVADCADFSHTVSPYLHQLRPLARLIFENISNPAALQQLYLDTNPLISAFAFSLFLVPIFLLVSEINKNYSQVDRCWSILPTVYNVHYVVYAHAVGLDTTRLDTLVVASALWSTRLTYNYFRKGGYSIGSEDYRWAILRQYISPPLFFIFNVLFISLAQSVLLFSITTPTYVLLLVSRLSSSPTSDVEPWELTDLIASGVLVTCVVLSFVADQQQRNYQTAKKSYQSTAKIPPNSKYTQEELDRGFLARGLFSYCRHPNFAAEQSFWLTLYQWGCWTTGTTYNWTGVGAVGYLLLFQASTWFTELLTAKKYPDYKEYQSRVAKFIPRFSRKPMAKWEQPLTTAGQKIAELQQQQKEKDGNKNAASKKR